MISVGIYFESLADYGQSRDFVLYKLRENKFIRVYVRIYTHDEMSHFSFGAGFSRLPIYLGAIPKTMSRNNYEITSAEEFAPFKAFFQNRQEEGLMWKLYICVYVCACHLLYPLNHWTDFLEIL
jgi:hypothetical protein